MPHFIRFLFFATAALIHLQYFIWLRLYALWEKRLLPSYLGPTITQMVLLFLLTIVTFLTLFGLSLLTIRTAWCILANTTTIEGWEIERHVTLVRRAKYTGGYLDGPDGTRIRIAKQEFPYDIGIWSNLAQAMGTSNPIMWLLPFAPSLPLDSGTVFEVNGFEDEGAVWPPPDPDRLFRVERKVDGPPEGFMKEMDVEAFKKRQAEDMKRYQRGGDEGLVRRRKPFHVRLEEEREKGGSRVYEIEDSDEEYEDGGEVEEVYERPANVVDDDDGEESWRNGEGERLADFGVDEDVEFYDEDDLPLAELMRLRREKAAAQSQ
ncbi:hypothetical protein B9Z65_759 [Elsinoe australis]|uniref:Protein S-acyltransferase n=1 Tax=Elsinoe australis TaxID=40998 RepID=A0A2P8AJJ6_9PEZI|nr:hypothetical protein B9Z65_759 [Elsinoe australis]